MRTDASQNRARILDAARELYAEKGLDVTMRAIARRAGLGVATLYRHFPHRQALVVAAFEHELADCDRLSEEALADPDPWRALRGMMDHVVRAQVGNRAFTWAFRAESRDEVESGKALAGAMTNITELVRRAQESGDLRADFSPSDLALLVQASDSLTATSPAAARRLVAYLLQSFSARTATLPAPEPVSVLGANFG
ncbi:TetR/AcrR family transcriptional regulator [Amycolatopsis panacis]|uniref:TetR/AcrR family transcriptional regulator n=1 Tax=Amycolatopsis panacis TaxID=2340917 RepID=A0A419I418_9PSEU|nr:TetR/AcrR family transcriptional regulator [Amycolatopsis panacis]RJQ85076.1 TetR/AcrR family transcriptional regulator [Amycolatopsis panacis]